MKKSFTQKWILSLSLATFVGASYASESAFDPFNIESQKTHKVTLLNHGLASFESRLQLIERAEKSIDVEYFIYRTDRSAKIFTQALIKKAREGVKVRVLLDYFMCKNDLSPFYAHELEKFGIEVKYFNTTSSLNMFSGQYRNHRKVLIVDGKEAITGGRNIGDEYFDFHPDYNFLDRDIVIEGELVSAIKKTFDETFEAKLSRRVPRDEKPVAYDQKYSTEGGVNQHQFEYDLKLWNDKVNKASSFVSTENDSALVDSVRVKGANDLSKEFQGTCKELKFISEYPNIGKKNRKENRLIKNNLFQRIEKSKDSILIDSPYFIVNNELSSSLNVALNNKVDIKLLTNSLNSTDAIYVYAAFDSIAKDWMNKGLDSYIFKGKRPESYEVIPELSGKARFGVHAKTFIFDNEDVIIGTYNVDPRSANYNSEMIISCENSPALAEEVRKDIEQRMAGSIHLDSEKTIKDAEFYQISFGKKLVYYSLKVPSKIFDYLL